MADETRRLRSREGWIRVSESPKHVNGRDYSRLVEFKRLCATCGESFSILVTKRIAEGHADTNNFGLRNCTAHRRSRINADVIAMRDKDRVMTEEMAGLYNDNRMLRDKIAVLESRLQNKIQKLPWEG